MKPLLRLGSVVSGRQAEDPELRAVMWKAGERDEWD